MSRSGLAVFNNSGYIYFLNRIKPYSDTNVNFKRAICKWNNYQLYYVEKYCIPRGKKKCNESSLQCSVREFIEETKCFFDKIKIYTEPFILKWSDPPDTEWKYKIYIAVVDQNDIFYINNKNDDISEIISKFAYTCEDKEYIITENIKKYLKITTNSKRINNENVIPKNEKYTKYKKLVSDNLMSYTNHNYEDFFMYLEKKFVDILR